MAEARKLAKFIHPSGHKNEYQVELDDAIGKALAGHAHDEQVPTVILRSKTTLFISKSGSLDPAGHGQALGTPLGSASLDQALEHFKTQSSSVETCTISSQGRTLVLVSDANDAPVPPMPQHRWDDLAKHLRLLRLAPGGDPGGELCAAQRILEHVFSFQFEERVQPEMPRAGFSEGLCDWNGSAQGSSHDPVDFLELAQLAGDFPSPANSEDSIFRGIGLQ